jgi:Arc/MetJ-type ribon-helix-helix transcriptional regulator
MTIHLPGDVESSILTEVRSGHFASVDEAIASAWRAYHRQRHSGQSEPTEAAADQEAPAIDHKPIWEEILELTAGVPDEEWDKLPVDGSEQHDHYIYGMPKRPPSP